MTNCGINYHRNSFAESIRLKADTYTVDELKGVCVDLTERINTYAGQVERDVDGVMVLSGNEREEAVAAMERLGEKWDVLAGYYPKPKPLAFSAFLSVQNLTGIYSPFTVEANYNQDMTPYNIPFTACHELSICEDLCRRKKRILSHGWHVRMRRRQNCSTVAVCWRGFIV